MLVQESDGYTKPSSAGNASTSLAGSDITRKREHDPSEVEKVFFRCL